MSVGEAEAVRVDQWLTEAVLRAEREVHLLRIRPDVHESACRALDELRRMKACWRATHGAAAVKSMRMVVECSVCHQVPEYSQTSAHCRTSGCREFGRMVKRESWNEKHWPPPPPEPHNGGDR